MSCEELYRELIERGVKFTIKGEHLAFSAAKGCLTPDLLNQMKRNKQGLLECVRASLSYAANHIAVRDTGVFFPASYGQEALWMIHQSNPTNVAYNTAAALRIHSPVNVDALRKALTLLIIRHEALRTTFDQRDTSICACVSNEPTLDFDVIDASGWDELQLAKGTKQAYQMPFDLKSGPLFRTRLFSVSPDDHVILLILHHIIFDATSLWILQDELQQLYQAEVEGSTGILRTLPATYREFADWQREFPETDEGIKQWNYWKNQLQGDPCPGELPWSSRRITGIQRSCTSITKPVASSTAKGLREVAKMLGTTPFCVAMSAFQVLVYRCGGQDDFVIGTSTSGRSQHKFANEIGYFVNILPIRATFTDSMSFPDLVSRTKKTMLDASQAAEFPFSLIVKRLNPIREAGAAPLCRMVFGWQKSNAFSQVAQLLDTDVQKVDWGGMIVQSYPLAQQEGQFDLTFEIHEGSKSLGCVLKYDKNLLTDEAAERFLERYVQLLGRIAADPHFGISDIDLNTPAEQHEILQWSRGGLLPLPTRSRVDDFWADSVQEHPNSVAFQYEDRSWSYSELDSLVNETALRFLEFGVEPGDRICLSVTRGPHVPICMLAAFKCGATYIPIAPDSPEERLRKILEECRPKLVVTGDELIAGLQSLTTEDLTVCGLSELRLDRGSLLCEQGRVTSRTPWARIEFPETTTAYIIYTSGSTGIPKGVVISHEAISYHVCSIAQVYELCEDDRVLQFSELTFDPSIEQFLSPWLVGAAVVMRADMLFSGEGFWQRVKAQGITVANLPPSFMVECVRVVDDTSSLRLMIVGGDVFPLQNLDHWLSKRVRTLNAYGPTETVITATTFDVSRVAVLAQGSVPIGTPKPGAVAYVIDRHGALCPSGVAGELYLGGPMLADGYVNGTPNDDARFTLDPFIGGKARMYKTGDWVKWSDRGELEFLGRVDRQIKVRGFRVELGEIEYAMLSIKGVEHAVVRLCESGGGQFLAGYFSLAPQTEATSDTVISHLKTMIPNYMIPDRLIEVDHWPLKASGKVDLDRLPTPDKRIVGTSAAPPENKLQQLIANSWCEVLELEAVGIDDDFLEIGGGSLQSLRILTKLSELGIVMKDKSTELTPQLLFQYTTIRELSLLLDIPSTENASGNTGLTDTLDTR